MNLRFGAFVLSPALKSLHEGGRKVVLGARAMELLLALTERPGELLTRSELMERAWPAVEVDDNPLRVQIAALRKALGEGVQGQRCIANVPGRGYIFVMAIVREPATQASAVAGVPAGAALPARAAGLIGRDAVLALLLDQVAERRMVSIVGPGGIGKTSVALAVASQLRQDDAGAVCFVDLDALTDGAMVASAVAAALGVVAASADVAGTICRFIAGRRVLIILDNCEHVADAAALLAERLLVDTTGAHLLATSREALAVQTEWVHRLAPLALPERGEGLSVAQAMGYSALQLLSARAGAFVGDFALNEGNLDSAVRLCEQLDGNPLAIELAAARIDSLGLAGLASRLHDLLALLTRGRRSALPRHRTLQAMLDWSYCLLGESERIVFNRLSMFRNSFCLDWAVQVGSCARIGAAEVIGCISSLSAKSLLSVESTADVPRYRLLNTSRLYGQLRLEMEGQSGAVALSHARCLLGVYVRADADLKVLPAAAWRARYGATADDFRSALDWAFSAQGDPDLGIEMTAVASFPMLEMGRVNEHRSRLCHALQVLRARSGHEPEVELRLLSGLLMIDANAGTGDAEGVLAYPRMRELIGQLDLPQRSLVGLHSLCAWAFGRGNYSLVRETAAQVSAIAALIGDPVAALLGERFMALGLHFLGEHAQAAALADKVLASTVAQRNVHLLGQVPRAVSMRAVQARMLWMGGQPDQALMVSSEALSMVREQHPFAQCLALGLCAIPLALWSGDHARASLLCDQLNDTVERYSISYWQSWVANFRRVLAVRSGAVPDAYWPIPANAGELDLLGTLVETMALDSTVQRVRQCAVGWCSAEILRAHGANQLRQGAPPAEVEALFREALAISRQQNMPAWGLRAAISLVRLLEGGAQANEARALLAAELAKFARGAHTADLTSAHALLNMGGDVTRCANG